MKNNALLNPIVKVIKLFYITLSNFVALTQDKAALPSSAHLEWSDAEIGAIFHFDMPTFKPEYNWRVYGTHPPALVFNPSKVNTDLVIKLKPLMLGFLFFLLSGLGTS